MQVFCSAAVSQLVSSCYSQIQQLSPHQRHPDCDEGARDPHDDGTRMARHCVGSRLFVLGIPFHVGSASLRNDDGSGSRGRSG